MKMNFVKLVPILLVLILVGGCSSISDSISEQEAKQLVISKHTNDNGTPQIVSIDIKWNAYVVEWKNEENKEGGTDKVTKEGEVKMIEAYIE
ncbi:hypothetical protein [Fusibacter ferrireducens]|uniref:Uncharacterized protein n=1 Tax=Fusibacter ferrireducens TaxID=2785058 RepID=A0ABR9ZMF5_9FIRM|nr:hypothetical protein [Fusibacter ferrireducens]MBF4691645.1 hypothetical protein [Fusibacter ferrireducens]